MAATAPEKRINTAHDFEKWQSSAAYKNLVDFILELNEAVKSKPLSAPCVVSPFITAAIGVLDTLDKWIDETPPTAQPTRYGNKAFRTWYATVEKEAENEMKTILPQDTQTFAAEVGAYLVSSIGNVTR